MTAHADARAVAHDVLVRVATTDAFADVLLGHRLAATGLGAADRGLATRLVFGTLAWQGRLDHHLAGLVRMPLERLDPEVLAALRMGLFQLLFLERIPPWASVDASVRLARRRGRGAAGLVNAVLRRAARRGRDGLVLPETVRDPLGRLALEWSHPRWLVERWAREIGPGELPALLAAGNARLGSALRVTAAGGSPAMLAEELAAAGVTTVPGRLAPTALLVERGATHLRGLPAWRDGRCVFQGEASQLVAPLLGGLAGARALDACAGRGGKTLHVAERAGPGGCVVALDPSTAGSRRLADECRRLGLSIVRQVVGDARHPPVRGPFDAVLVDAPCTGLGTLARHPEVRWRRHPDDPARLALLQTAILDGVAPLVRRGGVLVYAVCTITRDETVDVVGRLLAAHPRFGIESVAPWLPEAAVPTATTAEGFLRTLPHRHGVDGFFAARLRAAP